MVGARGPSQVGICNFLLGRLLNQANIPQCQSPTGWDEPLEYEDHIPAAPTVGRHHAEAGPSHPAPQPVAGDVFSGIGLSGPTRYTAPYFPMQKAQVGSSHLRHPQMFVQPQPYMNSAPQRVDSSGMDLHHPAHAFIAPLQHREFINLGDDNPWPVFTNQANVPQCQSPTAQMMMS